MNYNTYINIKRSYTPWLFITAMAILMSCSQSNISKSLEAAENVINENPDSTLSILREIDYEALEDNQLKALYGLLYTSANIKKQKVPDNDSLIDYSIKIFENNNDSYHLADSYYYKGASNYVRNQFKTSICYLKKAEDISILGGYNQITNKIYELLCYINYVSENEKKVLEYTRKFLDSSIKLHDNALIARAYTMAASAYANVNVPDSAYYFINQGLKYIDDVNVTLKADILVNVGEMYFEKKNFELSQKYAKKSDSIDSNPHAKLLLGKIEYQRGDTLKAKIYWEEAFSINDIKLKKQLYRILANYYAEIGQFNYAYLISSKLDSLNLDNIISTKEIQELQYSIDNITSETKLYQKIVLLLIIACLVCVILISFFFYHKKKVLSYNDKISSLSDENDIYKSEISDYSEKVNMYHTEIGLYVSKVTNYEHEISNNIEKIKVLKSTDRAKQKEIDTLKCNISTIYQSILTELRKGNTIYDTIKGKRPIVHYSDEDLSSLIDFYKVIKNDTFNCWLDMYYPLSVRQYLFLILEELGYDDYDIADILGVTDTTVRSTRSRIKKKTR